MTICQRIPIRFGNWNNAGDDGVAALNLNNLRSNVNTNIGSFLDFESAGRRLLKGIRPVHFIGRLCPARMGE